MVESKWKIFNLIRFDFSHCIYLECEMRADESESTRVEGENKLCKIILRKNHFFFDFSNCVWVSLCASDDLLQWIFEFTTADSHINLSLVVFYTENKRQWANRWNEFYSIFHLWSSRWRDVALETSGIIKCARMFTHLVLTSWSAFLSIVLLLCKVRMTFFAPSTTAASILKRWRSSSMRSSSDDSSCSWDRISPFSAAVYGWIIIAIEQS